MKHALFIVALMGILSLTGCEEKVVNTTKYPTVVRVFMHQPGIYSFQVVENGELKTIDPNFPSYKVLVDVEPGAPMWAEVQEIDSGDGSAHSNRITIHIHDPSQINGGEFKVGKTGSARTVPIE